MSAGPLLVTYPLTGRNRAIGAGRPGYLVHPDVRHELGPILDAWNTALRLVPSAPCTSSASVSADSDIIPSDLKRRKPSVAEEILRARAS